MTYRNANYAAFYVKEPFAEGNLGAYASYDFCYYQMLRAWKGQSPSFPFNDAHEKTYNVRDTSSWETLQSRLHERLRNSKNIILFLSSNTAASKALTEEIEYGIDSQGLPVIVVYPEFNPINWEGHISTRAKYLWDFIPSFKRLMTGIPTLHIPMEKEAIREALTDPAFMVQTKANPGIYRL